MKAEPITTLSKELLQLLQEQRLVLLSTTDFEAQAPSTTAISWIYAVNDQTLRFAVDARSRIIQNVEAQPALNVSVFALNTISVVYGKATVVTTDLPDVPFKLAVIDVAIDVIRDGMYYGARIAIEPTTEKTYDERAAKKLDGQVFAAMRAL